MHLPVNAVRACLDEARTIAEHYRRYHIVGDHARKNVRSLMDDVVAAYLGKQFHVRKLPIEIRSVSAMFWALNNNSYEIFVLEGLDEAQKRFILCKELFHIILDEGDCHSTAVAAHVEEVNATFPVLDSKPSPAVVSEVLAEAAAMEFLFPYADRERFLRDAVDRGVAPGFATVAAQYGLPEDVVQSYCSAPYMDYFGAFRA